MFWTEVSAGAAVFFLIFARTFAMLSTAPLFSSGSLPGMVRVGLCLLVSALVLPVIDPAEITSLTANSTALPSAGAALVDFGLRYVFLLVGEVFIGIIQGFFIQMVAAAFQTAGQFFSIQMGFGASAVFDPLAQEEVPLMGQFFNLAAMLVFLLIDGFQKIFFTGVMVSFQTVRAADLARARDSFVSVFAGGLSLLFRQALSMSFPIFGVLFLVSITMGLLAKAAPQMNLLILGFPLAILVTFSILFLVLPALVNTFSAIFENIFSTLEQIFLELRGEQA